uniref:receptor-like protein EIX2 n=1 Tax=Erigeron canadensis TaxID=72917 RepID=UPI001CB8C434|nr:receptor-like protein EIX2 [Erigeron canadensis]
MNARFSSSCHLCLVLILTRLFHFCSSSQKIDDALCLDVERNALLDFKHGLIDEADRLASWISDQESDCCKWAGIVCDNVTGHVRQIHLPGLNGDCAYTSSYSSYETYEKTLKFHRMRGDINSSLLHLKQLEHLDLSCNDFGGIQVPSFLGSLGNLNYLNLSNSNFSGIVPPQLGNLSQLNVLSLGISWYDEGKQTSMTSMQWLSTLRLLHHLDMSGVDLSEATDWFQVINTLSNLVELRLSGCELSNIYPDVPSLNLTSLTLLDLSFNNFNTSVPNWIFGINSLVTLDLSQCNLHNSVPNSTYSFRNLTSLKFLYVSENDFMNSSLLLKELSNTIASNLVLLDISSCGISSSVLDSLHNLTSLLSLYLSDNLLTKMIPKSFADLCNLREINLSGNDFSNISLMYLIESFSDCKSPRLESLSVGKSGIYGHLPDKLGHLIHLKILELSYNRISGTIPDAIGQLSSMWALLLPENLISGPIPLSIGRLSSLEYLYLSDNQLNGSIPDSLGQLSKLTNLDISYNLLTGVVTEAHFDKLVNLIYLNGKGNNLTLRPRLPTWIPPFQLQKLYLNSWVLGPQFPLWIQKQKDLIELDISNTHITEYMPDSFWRSFTNLECLDMSQNRIQGTLLSIPVTLRLLDLSYNKFGGKLTHLSNGSFPISLDLSNNLFAGSLHQLLCSNGEKETQALNLGNNNLSGVIPECWQNWPDLQFLSLGNNSLSGTIPRTLGSLSRLRSLSINQNRITGKLPASLMNLTKLVILQLGRNELIGSIPTWLGTKLSFLRLLNLRSNNFDGIIPHELCFLTNIQILDLADNNLSGSIQKCFNNFSILTGKENIPNDQFSFYVVYGGATIASDLLVLKGREDTYSTILELVMLFDLSSNQLVGQIPSEVTDLLKLKSLNFSRNKLTGKIPNNIGNLKSLETFDVSVNRLSGELPMSLSSLSFLSNFNVSNNNLTGKVPPSTQLQSFKESSFLGNNLCGAPLKSCAVRIPDTKDQNDEDNSEKIDTGLIISTVFGLVAGFFMIVTPLIISKSWRIAYFQFFKFVIRNDSKENW